MVLIEFFVVALLNGIFSSSCQGKWEWYYKSLSGVLLTLSNLYENVKIFEIIEPRKIGVTQRGYLV